MSRRIKGTFLGRRSSTVCKLALRTISNKNRHAFYTITRDLGNSKVTILNYVNSGKVRCPNVARPNNIRRRCTSVLRSPVLRYSNNMVQAVSRTFRYNFGTLTNFQLSHVTIVHRAKCNLQQGTNHLDRVLRKGLY